MLQHTNGRGFDVILSNGVGEEFNEIWHCVATLGRFIKIGECDSFENTSLSMSVLRKNVTFSVFDIETIRKSRPSVVSE